MIEVYKAINGKKSYIVSNECMNNTWKYARKFFRVANDRLCSCIGWVLNGELYLENPHNKKAVKRNVVYYHKVR